MGTKQSLLFSISLSVMIVSIIAEGKMFIRAREKSLKINTLLISTMMVGSLVYSISSPLEVFASTPGYAASDVLGQLTNGNPDLTTSATGTTQTGMSYPSGSTLDSVHHRLFVNDENNCRVLVYNLDSNNNLVSHVPVHVLGQTNYTTPCTGAPASQSDFTTPYLGNTYDPINDRLFVSDGSFHRILVFDLANGITDGMNASYVLGQSGFGATNLLSGQNAIQGPEGLAFDPTNDFLFAADENLSRVMVFNVNPTTIASNENAVHVLGQLNYANTSRIAGQNGLASPEALAYNTTTKQLFVGDSENHRVMIFNLANGITDGMNASYELGQPDFYTTNNVVTQSGMSGVQEGLGIDSQRDILYEADDDFNRILIFNLSNGITDGMNASMVLDQANFTSSDYSCNAPSAINLCDPEGDIAVDSANNRIYVSDSGFNRVLIYNFINLGSNTQGTLNTPFNKVIPTSNAQGTTSFQVVSGSLPPGLTLSTTTGVISGTPTAVGSYTFDVSLTDNNGIIGSFVNDPAYTITISSTGSTALYPTSPNTGFGRPVPENWSEAIVAIILSMIFATTGYLSLRYKNYSNSNTK